MTRHVLLLDLVDDADLIAAYEDWHGPGRIPPEVTASIRAADIASMQIWRCDDRLVMVMETGAGFDPAAKAAADAANPDVQAWERLMDGMQRRLARSGPEEKWRSAQLIYDLVDH